MCRDPRLAMLLDRWEKSAERGQRLSAEELCVDCPELIEPVREQIQKMGVHNAATGAGNTVSDNPREAATADTQGTNMGTILPSSGRESPVRDGSRVAPKEDPVIGHFRKLKQLGSGGFGTVWKAHDTLLDRIVAIKIPNSQRMSDNDVERFVREGKAAAQLKHPNIVGVYDVASQRDMPYIVSEFVDGVSLDTWLKSQRLNPHGAAQICFTLAEAMQHAHGFGVIHRDLKPSNVVMDAAGKPYVMDFGLAKRDADDVTMTAEGAILGTPAYMAPEQACGDGHDADARSDVYSLGVLLFEALTGERPFRGSLSMILKQVREVEPPRPRSLANSIPRDLETICLKCLEKEPSRRYQTAGELADDLQRYLSGREIEARPIGTLGRIWRWYRANSSAAVKTAGGYSVLSGCILLCWSVLGIIFFSLKMHPSENPGRALLELMLFCLVVYPLLIATGIATLNGRIFTLCINMTFWLGWLAITGTTMIGIFPAMIEMEIMAIAQSNVYVQLQLFSLLSVLCLFGVATHAAAIFLHYSRPESFRDEKTVSLAHPTKES